MKKTFYLFMMCVLAFAMISCQSSQPKNMVVLQNEQDPTVSFRLLFKIGSVNDPAGKEGLAALTAEMIANGGTKKHSLEEINEMLYPMAAGIYSQVDKEMTVFAGRTHKDNLEAYYKILKEVLLEPGFRQEDFDRIKSNILNYLEKDLRYADDEELGKEVLSEFIFEGTPYEHLEEGHISSIKSITLDDVRNFYQTHFTRSNLIIGIGGGADREFIRKVEKDFTVLPEDQPAQPTKPSVKPINGHEVMIVEKEANATAISFGFPIDVLRGSKDFYALAIANSWLGEHRNSSSHLYQVIREKRGLNYGDYSYIEHFPNGGRRQFPPANVARHQQIFQIWIRPVPNETRVFAFRAALRELQKLVDNGLTEAEFELTRKFLKNYVLHYAPTTMLKLGYALDDAFYGIKGSHLSLFRAMMDQLTLQDVNAAIRKHLQYKNMKIVFITKDAAGLKQALVSNAPSPIQYATPKPPEVLEEDKEIINYPLNIPEENVKIVKVEDLFN